MSVSNNSSAISLYTSNVMHQRYFPQVYHFNYAVLSLLIDIDEIEKAAAITLFSYNKFNLYSVYSKDHGACDETSWRVWVDNVLDNANLSKAKHQIKLLCFPRILGYAFNPLSIWYCYGEDKQVYAIICEVRNTFGEHHHYLLHNNNAPYTNIIKANKSKQFHVSPFISMDAEYRFVFNSPDEKLNIIINEYQSNKLMLTAAQQGKLMKLTTRELLFQFFRLPLMTSKVMLMIHWQALKIWLRGGEFYKKPNKPKHDIS